jgi:hypothetical protein
MITVRGATELPASPDLSHFHGPISNQFRSQQPPGEDLSWPLTAEQIEFYRREGYLSGIRLLSDEQIEALRSELATFVQLDHPGKELWYEYHSNESTDASLVLFHALGAWRIGQAFHDLLWHPGFVTAASQLLEGPVRFWHDQLFCKPAQHGGVVAWHQDYSYWTRTAPMAHLTCWIALDDSDRDNGCVEYIPGSHRWDLLPITGLAGDMNAIRQVLNDEQWEKMQHPVAAELKAGYATFHHPLMVHGSRENRTARPRRATVINAVRDGVCSQSDQPLLAGVTALSVGQPLGGQFFPLLGNAPGW